jgi:hypothetical protein
MHVRNIHWFLLRLKSGLLAIPTTPITEADSEGSVEMLEIVGWTVVYTRLALNLNLA